MLIDEWLFLNFGGKDGCTVFVLFESSPPPLGASIVIIRKLFLVLLRRLEMTTLFRVSRSCNTSLGVYLLKPEWSSKESVFPDEEKKTAKGPVTSH